MWGGELNTNNIISRKQKRHLQQSITLSLGRTKTVFIISFKETKRKAKSLTLSVLVLEKVQEASYKVTEIIIKAKKLHTLARTLFMLDCKNVATITLCPEAATNISEVPPPADNICCHGSETSGYIKAIWKGNKFVLGRDSPFRPMVL
jgi:hypothetical protein